VVQAVRSVFANVVSVEEGWLQRFLKVFASLLWWILNASLALLLWESDLNTWVPIWVGFGLGFLVVLRL
ncbi:hypothetical protein, partial [Mycobacterium tuberculosis]|uniref:hypothetical protein n=1 Tax=Mycobacterium tuberculosis TaxID=1773 RepID=UPI001AE16B0E